jgi:hypothetical protein
MKTIKFNITRLSLLGIVCLALISPDSTSAGAKGDEFGAVVQAIERYYHVKHQSIPFLARAGMKTATTAMRIRGGQYKRLAEAGSIRIAFFEDQDFDSRGGLITFKTSLVSAVGETWSPLIQTLSPKDESQTYIFIRNSGEKGQRAGGHPGTPRRDSGPGQFVPAQSGDPDAEPRGYGQSNNQ